MNGPRQGSGAANWPNDPGAMAPSSAVVAIERELFAHPVHVEFRELNAFEQTLVEVFVANSWELSQLLTAAAENEKLAVELMQNVHEPTVADAFRGATSRTLHSYLASSATVIDHARRLMRGRKGPLAGRAHHRCGERLVGRGRRAAHRYRGRGRGRSCGDACSSSPRASAVWPSTQPRQNCRRRVAKRTRSSAVRAAERGALRSP